MGFLVNGSPLINYQYLGPVDTSLIHLFYIYSNSSKNVGSWRASTKSLKDSVRSMDHKLRAMGKLLEKFGLYVGTYGTWKILRLRQSILLPVQPCRENWKNWWTPKFFVLYFSQTFWLKLRNSACYYYYYYYYYYYFYSYARKRFYWVTFKLEDIHRPKFCATTFFICHYTDIGNDEWQSRIGLFTPFKNKFQ